jgi:hypothetical protein
MIAVSKTVSLYVKGMWHSYISSSLLYGKGELETKDFQADDVDSASQEKMLAYCLAFYDATWEFLRNPTLKLSADQVGHLLALEHSGNGVGFKDVEIGTPEIRKRLADAAREIGTVCLHVQDGKVSIAGGCN